MTEGLSLRHALEHEHVWGATRTLLERLVTALGQDEYLDAFLDVVVELLGADRGLLVVSYPDGAAQVVNARGGQRALSTREREEVSKTVVARALAEDRVVCWDPFGEGDATRSMADLGIWMALAAPVHAPAWRRESLVDEPPPRGALYVDFRDRRKLIGPLHQDFFATAALLLGGLFEQGRRLDVAHAVLRETLARRPDREVEHAPPSLDELLRPPGMAGLRAEVRSLVLGESPFVVLGESGTGKTQLARAIAEASGRRPVVRAMLGASDDLNTLTSELFGHERGAFSGAVTRRRGLVEHADGGTLVLDELMNLPLHAQRLLLDFTQFGTYRPLGHAGAEPKRAKVRLIAATNGDLERALAAGTLREDLYYRLAGAVLRVPPLRERRGDIPLLAEGLLRRLDPGRSWSTSVELRRLLLSESLAWNGNVRQLEAVLRRARERAIAEDADATRLDARHVEPADLGAQRVSVPPPATVVDPTEPLTSRFQVEPAELGDTYRRLAKERATLDAFEAETIRRALERHDGIVTRAARELDLPRTSLLSRMDTLGIPRPARGPGRPRGSEDEPT